MWSLRMFSTLAGMRSALPTRGSLCHTMCPAPPRHGGMGWIVWHGVGHVAWGGMGWAQWHEVGHVAWGGHHVVHPISSRLKSFDYRLLHALLGILIGAAPSEELLSFLRVDEVSAENAEHVVCCT